MNTIQYNTAEFIGVPGLRYRTLIENKNSAYSLVYEGKDPEISDIIRSVNDTIGKKLGYTLPLKPERSEDPDAREIIVGSTSGSNEEDGEPDLRVLGEDGYLIRNVRNRILILGNTVKGISLGFHHFSLLFTDRKRLAVPEGLYYIHRAEEKITALTVNGRSIRDYVIVCDTAASPSVHTAASHLRQYIGDAAGVFLPIVKENGGKPFIRLDHTAFTDDESFSVRTEKDGIVIGGSPVRGLLYGVYHFLEKYVGWQFLPYDTDVLTKKGDVAIETGDEEYTPHFAFRDPFWCSCSLSRYAVKRMVNSGINRNDDPSLGGFFGFTGPSVHTFSTLLGIGRFEQPCMSSEETYEKLLAGVLDLLKKTPDARLISVSQNDTPAFCTCPRCTGKDIGGNYTDGLLRLVNRIAEAVEKDYPKVMIHTLAYTVTREPPKVIKPRDNVVIQLCTIECCFRHALNDPHCERNRKLCEDIIGWSKVCKNIYIWDYTTDFRFYLVPFPNFRVLAANIRFFHEHHVKGLFEQGNEFNLWGEFGELRAHLITQLMEDPCMSEETYDGLIDRFLQGYYGPGWRYIRKYFDYLNENSAKKEHYGIYATPEGLYCAQDFVSRSAEIGSWFDTAEQMSDAYGPLKHLRDLRLHFTYMKWYFRYDDVMKTGDPAAIAAAKEECADLFDDLCDSYIRLMDVRAPLGYYIDCPEKHLRVDKTASPRTWDPLAHTVNIPENGFST